MDRYELDAVAISVFQAVCLLLLSRVNVGGVGGVGILLVGRITKAQLGPLAHPARRKRSKCISRTANPHLLYLRVPSLGNPFARWTKHPLDIDFLPPTQQCTSEGFRTAPPTTYLT